VAEVAADAAPNRWWRSVRVRVTAGATAVFAVAFIGAGLVLVNRVHASLEDQVRREGVDTADFLKSQVESGVPIDRLRAANPNQEIRWILYADDGSIVGGSSTAPVARGPGPGENGPATGAGAVGAGGVTDPGPVKQTFEKVAGPEDPPPGDALIFVAQANTPQGPVTIATAGPLEAVRQSVDALTHVLALGTPLLIAALALLIWYFVGRALRPVDTLCAEVEEITHSTLHRRVAAGGANDELDRLARTMNLMLDRLEGADEQQRQFVSDASHELKTPLATIRTSVEVALRDPEHADWELIGRRVLAADAQMEDLVSDLLELARLDEGVRRDGEATEAIDLDELVLARLAEVPRSQPGGVAVDGSAVVAGRVRGDRRGLDRLVRNLVANATAHASSRVAVALDEADGWVCLVVDDDGPGVPVADRQRVFDRFARLESSRAKAPPRAARAAAEAGPAFGPPVGGTAGTGLGLAIVEAVAEAHGGTVEVGDAPLGGARFTVRLPAAPTG